LGQKRQIERLPPSGKQLSRLSPRPNRIVSEAPGGQQGKKGQPQDRRVLETKFFAKNTPLKCGVFFNQLFTTENRLPGGQR